MSCYLFLSRCAAAAGAAAAAAAAQNPRWQPPIEQDSWLEDQLEVALGVSGSATTFDPPAMPPDVLKAVQLFNSRPDVW